MKTRCGENVDCMGITAQAQQSAEERWGFAFSAKKTWQSKVEADLGKIAETKRGYKKVFFVTNQYVRDKLRAQVEDEQSKLYGFEVRILDRTWILDEVFGKGLELVAEELLDLNLPGSTVKDTGPNDLARAADLEMIEQDIQQHLERSQTGLSLVQLCLTAAEYCRSLERSREEVDGMFLRAKRMADQFGTSQQQFEVLYQMAWTAYWWHEDFGTLAGLYPEIERLALESRNLASLERLSNLWHLLSTSIRVSPAFDNKGLKFESRTISLATVLQDLAGEEDRPTGSLQARILGQLQSRFASHNAGDAPGAKAVSGQPRNYTQPATRSIPHIRACNLTGHIFQLT